MQLTPFDALFMIWQRSQCRRTPILAAYDFIFVCVINKNDNHEQKKGFLRCSRSPPSRFWFSTSCEDECRNLKQESECLTLGIPLSRTAFLRSSCLRRPRNCLPQVKATTSLVCFGFRACPKFIYRSLRVILSRSQPRS